MRGSDLTRIVQESGLKPQAVYTRAGIQRGRYYKILSPERKATVEDLALIARGLGREPGDLLPNSGSAPAHLRLVEPLAEELHRLPLAPRDAMLQSFRVQLQAISPHLVAPAPSQRDNVVPFPPAEERRPLSVDAMERIARVMKEAGIAEPRKGARGREYEVRFFGLASAGEGVELFEEIPEEHRQIPEYYWKKGARGVLKAVGDSMVDVGIFENDILFVKPTPEPASGELVICTVNRKVYVKQLKRDGRGVPKQLLSKNPSYAPIALKPDDEVEFFGVVVGRTGDL